METECETYLLIYRVPTLKVGNCGEDVTIPSHYLYKQRKAEEYSGTVHEMTAQVTSLRVFSAEMYPASFNVRLTACDNKEIYARQRG